MLNLTPTEETYRHFLIDMESLQIAPPISFSSFTYITGWLNLTEQQQIDRWKAILATAVSRADATIANLDVIRDQHTAELTQEKEATTILIDAAATLVVAGTLVDPVIP
jgi:hypothetical protein